jgi:hypothetical protein
LIFSGFIPIINLQGNQNPDDYKENLTYSVFKILSGLAVLNQVFTDVAKEFDH